jgi:hypothetical protein
MAVDENIPEEPGLDLSQSWKTDELSMCPLCGQRKVIPAGTSTEIRFCIDCGWSETATDPRPERGDFSLGL